MSFPISCQNCGAPSTPAVGVCPYCKAVFQTAKIKENPTITNIKSIYEEGDLPKALSLASLAEKDKPDLLKNPNFVLLYGKILLEAEAPSSKIRAIFQKAQMEHGENQEITDYLEILQAKGNLKAGKGDTGEEELKNILRRSPKNPHAAFLLGSHLFWVEKDHQAGLIYLEKAVRHRPNFLRAVACLASLYKQIGSEALARKLFQKCVSLEKDSSMKEFFKKLASGASL